MLAPTRRGRETASALVEAIEVTAAAEAQARLARELARAAAKEDVAAAAEGASEAKVAAWAKAAVTAMVEATDTRGWRAMHHAVNGGHRQLAAWLAGCVGSSVAPTARGGRPLVALHSHVGGAIALGERLVSLPAAGSEPFAALSDQEQQQQAGLRVSESAAQLGGEAPAAAAQPSRMPRPATAPSRRR